MDEKNVVAKREAVRKALTEYERELVKARESVPRGSGHAPNQFDNLSSSLVEVRSARRVLWMAA